MPWCPNCKNEYREGIKVCADCGADLVIELPKEDDDEFVGVFRESALEKKEKTPADKGFSEAFFDENIPDVSIASASANFAAASSPVPTGVYRDNAAKAEDNRSSGLVLLAVGGLGIVGSILCLIGVIPLQLGNPYLFYGVMMAVFILFFVMGVISMKNAVKFDKKAKSDHTLEDTLLAYVKANLHPMDIDIAIGAREHDPIEELYYKRTEYIRAKLNHQFVNLDPAFLENMIDSKIYEDLFPEK